MNKSASQKVSVIQPFWDKFGETSWIKMQWSKNRKNIEKQLLKLLQNIGNLKIVVAYGQIWHGVLTKISKSVVVLERHSK